VIDYSYPWSGHIRTDRALQATARLSLQRLGCNSNHCFSSLLVDCGVGHPRPPQFRLNTTHCEQELHPWPEFVEMMIEDDHRTLRPSEERWQRGLKENAQRRGEGTRRAIICLALCPAKPSASHCTLLAHPHHVRHTHDSSLEQNLCSCTPSLRARWRCARRW
jgi:hypothetical protein